MDPKSAHARLEEVTVLDVREQHEWDAGHVEGSVHIPMGKVVERLGEVDTGRPVLVVCRSGHRSGQVAAYLSGRGITADNLDGGLQEWAGVGLPLASSSGTEGTVA